VDLVGGGYASSVLHRRIWRQLFYRFRTAWSSHSMMKDENATNSDRPECSPTQVQPITTYPDSSQSPSPSQDYYDLASVPDQ
jgi:hypothetical protein